MPESDIDVVKRMYDCFNARDIEGVLAALDKTVAWANGMEGGHVHGREAVRDYWTRQWALVRPRVEPVAFQCTPDGAIVVEVVQSLFDLDGQPLDTQVQGLANKTVRHIFQMNNGTVARFDIQADA
ncbi:MAG TPA: nuclear transport factor 2 family protein [Castellaniella sp.]|nr:nuclear transport factor 2 family protein [Castellaniella sp.]